MNEIANALHTASCMSDLLNFKFTQDCITKLGGMVLDSVPGIDFNKPVRDVVQPNFWTTQNFYFYAFIGSILFNFVCVMVIRRLRK